MQQRPKKRRLFGLSNFWLIVGGVLLLSFVWNLFTPSFTASEIEINQLLNNIRDNRYSEVNVRDDGRVLARGKTVYGTTLAGDLQIESAAVADVEQIDQARMLELILPLDFSGLVDSLKNLNEFVRIDTIYVGEDFLLLDNANSMQTDYLLPNVGEQQFRNILEEEGLEFASLDANVRFLRVVLGERPEAEIEDLQAAGNFDSVWVLDELVIAELTQEAVTEEFVYQQPGVNFFSLLQDEGIDLDSTDTNIKSVVIPTVPWGDLLTFATLIGLGMLAFFMFRGVQGSGNSLMKFGQSKARMIFGKKPDVTFADVAGVDEAKEQLQEIVLFLKDPKRFLEMGARIPKGVLLVGAPGTGKTLLARAIAGEAGVPFFHTSGSEFEEMLVGAGASRVRDLFEKAKKASPAIIFIDEIDAVARKRGTTIQSGTTEQTLNQILVEMDGFEKNTNVIVIAATNRPDVLDTAILRPGRFDRRVVLDLPDIEGRKQIIKIHAKNKPIADSVDMEKLAKRTVGLSGADIENLLNEAAIIVAKDNRTEILFNDLEEAANKVQIGPAKKRKRSDDELRMTAYHEAGHALVMKLTPEHDPVHRVTIVSRGMALGYTMPLPERDEVQMSKTKMMSKITALVAGYATEQIVFDDVTSGAANDIDKASNIARKMVKQFGMSKKLGLVKYGQGSESSQHLGHDYSESRNYSDDTAKIIDEEVRNIIGHAYQEAEKLIKKHRKTLDKIVDSLMEKEVLDADEFNAFFQ